MAEKHTVELFLRQNVSEALKAAGSAALETRLGLAKVGPAAKASFEMAGGAMTMLNQSLEVGKKAIEMFRATIGASIETSLQFRKEGDATVQYFKDLGRESELVRARIGDALLPVIQGFTEAAGEATGSVSEWIAENQRLIGSGLVDFLGKTATMLTSGIANAIVIVTKAFYGWQIVIDGVKVAVNAMFSGALSIIDDFLATTQQVAQQVGAKGLAASIDSARKSVRGLGAEFDTSSEAAQNGILETAAKLDAVEKTIRKVETSVKDVIERGMVVAQERVAQATIGTTRTIEEQTATLQRQADVVQKIMDRRIAAIEEEAALRERDARAIDAQMQAESEGEMTAGQAAMSLAGSAGIAGGIAQGAVSGGAWGAAAAAGGAVIQNSEALQSMIGKVNDMFTSLTAALEPLFQAIAPVVDVVGQVVGSLTQSLAPLFRVLGRVIRPVVIAMAPLTEMFVKMNPAMKLLEFSVGVLEPVINGLSQVLKKVAGFVLDVGEAIAGVWNGIVDAVASLLKKLGSISVFGQKPLGFLQDWGDDLQAKAKISLEAFDEARRRMEDGYDAMSESIETGADKIDEATQEIQESMMNVPTGLKIALNRFRAMTGEPSMVETPQSVAGVDRARWKDNPAVTQNTFTGPIKIYGVTNIEEMQQQIQNEADEQERLRSGPLAWAGGR